MTQSGTEFNLGEGNKSRLNLA